MRIDLHTHSTASDGTDSPAGLIAAAAAAGLDVVAITDHDTTGGWAAALAARPDGLTVVPGVEFSCVHHDAGGRRVSLHLLAYLADPQNEALQAEWTRLRAGRVTRGKQMVDNLVADGYPISWAQVSALAADGSVGRPHIGRALVDSGVVPDVSAAFGDLLSSRRPYYVRKPDTDVFEAIALVCGAGGLPVFAHPLARRRGPVVSDDTIAAMTAAGLVGLEVDHPDHDDTDRAHARELARDLGLLGTGSSDYHGTNKPTPIGACLTDPEVYEQLVTLPRRSPPSDHDAGWAARAADLRRHAHAAVLLHTVATGHLRLPAPLPLHLPRPPDATARGAVGTQHRRRGGPPGPRAMVVAAALAPHAGRGRVTGRAELAALRLPRRPAVEPGLRGHRRAGPRLPHRPRDERRRSRRRPGRRRTDGRRAHRDARGVGSRRPHRRAWRRTGDRRLQDRPRTARHRRRPHVARAGAVRPRRAPHLAPGLPTRRVAPPAHRTVAAFEHTEDTLGAHLDGAEHAAHRIGAATERLAAGGDADTVFPAAASPSCSWCDFRSACPEGRAASEPVEPWAGVVT